MNRFQRAQQSPQKTDRTPLLSVQSTPTNPTKTGASGAGALPPTGQTPKADADFKPPDSSHFLGKYAPHIVVSYLLLGATAFWLLERDAQGWNWWDGCYFATVTLTTVGYGDLVPTTVGAKFFAVFYILLGLSLVASSVGMMTASVEEKVEEAEEEVATADRVSKGRERMARVFAAVGTLLLLALIGLLFVHFNEGFAWSDSFYWAFVTLSSVGYGDLTIAKESTRIFLIFYIFFGVAATASALGTFAQVWGEIEEENHTNAFIERGVSEAMIREIDDSGDCSVDKWEFMSYMLVKTGKVAPDDIKKVEEVFNLLDVDQSGEIDLEDVRRQQRLRRAHKLGFGGGGGGPGDGAAVAKKPKGKIGHLMGKHRGNILKHARQLSETGSTELHATPPAVGAPPTNATSASAPVPINATPDQGGMTTPAPGSDSGNRSTGKSRSKSRSKSKSKNSSAGKGSAKRSASKTRSPSKSATKSAEEQQSRKQQMLSEL